MCGICGFVGAEDRATLKRMTDRLAHRGPNAEGFWSSSDRRVHFGHRRLSVVDLTGGAQPMTTSDDELTIVFNGEIYNHRELRAELQRLGHRFVTDHSDTEVLLHGYREWGEALPQHLNGMWAWALHDRRAQRLFCSRDRFGKKPFYYASTPDGFAFASELGSLREHPAVKASERVSRRALQKYFAYGYVPAPLSLLENVSKLPGGHSLSIELKHATGQRANLVPKRYWSFVLEPQDEQRGADELAEELRAKLSAAVARRLVADVPIGVFLSGGVDSSAVAAFAQKLVPEGRLKTFSIGFEEPSFDETTHARRVAQHLGTEHAVETLSLERARALLPKIAAQLDEPMADSSLLPCYLLSEFTRKHVTVALSGDGSDELLAGYDPFHALKKAELYGLWVPKPVHQAIKLLVARMPVSHRNMSFDFKLKRTLRGLDGAENLRLPLWMAPLTPAELSDYFGETIEPEDVFSEAIESWERCAQTDAVSRTLQFYTELYLQDDILTKVDRASMMHGLEVRSPFLDFEVVEFVRKLPARWKFSQGQTKWLLKKALQPLLPAEILERPKKGFGVPVGAWFQSGALELREGRGVGAEFSRRAMHEHRAGTKDHRAFLWAEWLLDEWERAG